MITSWMMRSQRKVNHNRKTSLIRSKRKPMSPIRTNARSSSQSQKAKPSFNLNRKNLRTWMDKSLGKEPSRVSRSKILQD